MAEKPKMIKIHLYVVDEQGKNVGAHVLDQVNKEYAKVEYGEKLTDEEIEVIRARGALMDYRQTLLLAVKRADNPERGMAYDEIERTRALVARLKGAESGGYALFNEAEFATICQKVKAPLITEYNENFDRFIQSVLSSEKVDVDSN